MSKSAEDKISDMQATVSALDATVTEWIKGHDKHSATVIDGVNRRVDACDKNNVEIFKRLNSIDVEVGKVSEKLDLKPCSDHSDEINGVFSFVKNENEKHEERVEYDISERLEKMQKSIKLWILCGVTAALFSILVAVYNSTPRETKNEVKNKITSLR